MTSLDSDAKSDPEDRIRCGTYDGYLVHARKFEFPCVRCRSANAAYQRLYRWKRGMTLAVPTCQGCGSIFGDHVCAAPRGSAADRR